jgi:hypothetical protein
MVLTAYFIEGGDFIMHDGFGFWHAEESTVFYKLKNKDSYEYKVNLAAFPLVVRFENEPVRDIKGHILAMANYRRHREFVQSKPKEQENVGGNQSEELICEEEIQEVGLFKAYKNRVVVARFEDKTLITVRNQEIRIIGPSGRSLVASLTGNHPKEFR